jgi:hypothetical protein
LLEEEILVADQSTCLCIVSRDRVRGSDFIAALGASLRPHEQLEIIVDRRSEVPAGDWEPAEERRRRPQVDLALKANGFAIVPAPSPGGPRRTLSSLLVPSAGSSRYSDSSYSESAYSDPTYSDATYDDVADDDEERLEAIRSFKRERSRHLVPWLIAALAAVAVAVVILSPIGHALKDNVARRWSSETTSVSSQAPPAQPPAAAAPSRGPVASDKPGPVAGDRPGPAVADRPAAADAPVRATVPDQVDRPLRGPASPGTGAAATQAPPSDAARADAQRETLPPVERNAPPSASTAPSPGQRARSTDAARSSVGAPDAPRPAPSASAPRSRPTPVAPVPEPEPASRSVSPRFAGLPRVELSREPSSAGGTYSARIVDPAGKPLPDAEVLLLARMPDGTVENVRMDFYPDRGTYRGSLPTTASPLDLRVRVITGDKRVEIPLGP